MKRVNSFSSKMVIEFQGFYNNVDVLDFEDKERKIFTLDGVIIFLFDNFEACDKFLIGDSDVYSDQMDQGQIILDELDIDSVFDMDLVELVLFREFFLGKDWAKLRKGGGGKWEKMVRRGKIFSYFIFFFEGYYIDQNNNIFLFIVGVDFKIKKC